MTYYQDNPLPLRERRRLWPILLPVAIVLVAAAGWTTFWYVGAAQAERALSEWREREGQAGRIYTCQNQTVGGFPFRFELTCTNPYAELRTNNPPVALRFRSLSAHADLFTPTVFTTAFTGPLDILPVGQAPLRATWSRAEATVSGTPTALESVSVVLDAPVFSRMDDPVAATPLVRGDHMEAQAVVAAGTVFDRPVIDVSIRLDQTSAPGLTELAMTPELQALMAQPTDAQMTATIRGLKDLRPRPAPEALREWQANGGRFDIMQGRLQQGDIVSQATGQVGLSPRGALDGQIDLVVANFEKLVPALGLDRVAQRALAPDNLERMGLGGLNRLLPGLSNVLANNAAPLAQAGLGMLGKPAQLDGKRALALPLKFTDGDVFLGPVKLGQAPPVF